MNAFYRRVRRHYADDAAWTQERRADFKGRGHEPNEDTAWTFEPHVAERLFNELVRESKVPVVLGQALHGGFQRHDVSRTGGARHKHRGQKALL